MPRAEITRQNAGHLGLGAGAHSGVGALLVRMAAISATRASANKLADRTRRSCCMAAWIDH